MNSDWSGTGSNEDNTDIGKNLMFNIVQDEGKIYDNFKTLNPYAYVYLSLCQKITNYVLYEVSSEFVGTRATLSSCSKKERRQRLAESGVENFKRGVPFDVIMEMVQEQIENEDLIGTGKDKEEVLHQIKQLI